MYFKYIKIFFVSYTSVKVKKKKGKNKRILPFEPLALLNKKKSKYTVYKGHDLKCKDTLSKRMEKRHIGQSHKKISVATLLSVKMDIKTKNIFRNGEGCSIMNTE